VVKRTKRTQGMEALPQATVISSGSAVPEGVTVVPLMSSNGGSGFTDGVTIKYNMGGDGTGGVVNARGGRYDTMGSSVSDGLYTRGLSSDQIIIGHNTAANTNARPAQMQENRMFFTMAGVW